MERDGTILTGCSCSHPTFFSHRNPTRKKVPCCVRQPLFYSPPSRATKNSRPSARSPNAASSGLDLASF